MEYAAQGDLFSYLHSLDKFTEKRSAEYISQICSAIDYCHSKHVIYRDIKSENILVSLDGSLKVADFRWSVHAPSNRRKKLCGMLDYLPHEMIESREHDFTVGIWSLGVLLYEFIAGKPLFESRTQKETCSRIVNADLKFPSLVTPLARDLILKLIQKDSSEGMPLKEVREHPWMVQQLGKL